MSEFNLYLRTCILLYKGGHAKADEQQLIGLLSALLPAIEQQSGQKPLSILLN